MKTKILTVLSVICVLAFVNAAKADIDLSTGSGWGTAFSDVHEQAYYYKDTGIGTLDPSNSNYVTARSKRSSATAKVDTWDYRLSLLEDYLADTLSTNAMNTIDKTATSSSPNYGLLSTTSHQVNKISDSKNTAHSIYGRKADVYASSSTAVNNAWSPLLRNGTGNVLSTAAPLNDSADHNWVYHPGQDKMVVTKHAAANAAGDHNTGLYAFVNSFNYTQGGESVINGWFSTLGEFVDIYINGVNLSETNALIIGTDLLSSEWFESYDISIDLAALYAEGIVQNGNNNIAFIVDAKPLDYYVNRAVEHGINEYDDGGLAFAAGLTQTFSSLPPEPPEPPQPPETPETPEPATLLIIGMGLAGLGIRRKMMNKKSA
jgi:hypothetical protein